MDKELLKKIATLSRIKLTTEEIENLTPQMQTILEAAGELQKIDTKDTQPMKKHVKFSELREDIPGETLTLEEVLRNAKHKESGCVKVYGKIFGGIEES
jgi:aspartyl-tRNA(Asn)/glutamyl-tRNA(Gln) amidotransferase subunit C